MKRITAVIAAGAVALGGAGLAACGDDNEGPAEDAGKAIDDAGKEVEQEVDDDGKKEKD